MRPNLIKKIFLFNFLIILSNSCAYFNTFYNANQYYEEANKIRLEKDGQAVPITAMDKYGKAIEKCKKVLKVNSSRVIFTQPKTLREETVDVSRLVRVFVNNSESHKRSVK